MGKIDEGEGQAGNQPCLQLHVHTGPVHRKQQQSEWRLHHLANNGRNTTNTADNSTVGAVLENAMLEYATLVSSQSLHRHA